MFQATQTSPSQKCRFRSKSFKIMRFNNTEREKNTLEQKIMEKTQFLTKAKINSIARQPSDRVRKYTQIEDESNFSESPLKLSPFKQYESKLKLSGQSWVIYDLKTNKYKRGWKANKVCSFRGCFRIIVLQCYCQIIRRNLNLKKLRVKISHKLLKQVKLRQKRSNKKNVSNVEIIKNKKMFMTFEQGTIVYLIDLVKSMIIGGDEDLLEYALIYCGFLLTYQEEERSGDGEVNIYDLILDIKNGKESQYIIKCSQYCTQRILKDQNLRQTAIQQKGQYFELISTPNQISIIFIKAFNQQSLFRELVRIQKHSFYIKYQVGYNYWEDRVFTIESEYVKKKGEHFCCLVYKGVRNYDVICYNSECEILIVIEDSKHSMSGLDVGVLENWYKAVTKPIASNPKQQISSTTISSNYSKQLISSNNNSKQSLSPLKKKKTITFPVLQISKVIK